MERNAATPARTSGPTPNDRELVGERVRATVQLSIGCLLTSGVDRDAFWASPCMRRKKLMDTVGGKLRCSVVPVPEQLLLLDRFQEGQCDTRPPGLVTTASRSTCRCPIIRSILAASNRSVLYSTDPSNPSFLS